MMDLYISLMYSVYLISCGEVDNKKYKIGYTKKTVEQRVKQLKTGNSDELIIEKVYSTKWASKIESILHKNYKSSQISGEWFYLTQIQVDNFLIECQKLDLFFEDWIKNSTFQNPKTILRY